MAFFTDAVLRNCFFRKPLLCRFYTKLLILGNSFSLFNCNCPYVTMRLSFFWLQTHLSVSSVFIVLKFLLSTKKKNIWHFLLMTGCCHALTGVCPIVIMEHTGNCCSSLAMGLIRLSFDISTSRLYKTTVHWSTHHKPFALHGVLSRFCFSEVLSLDYIYTIPSVMDNVNTFLKLF